MQYERATKHPRLTSGMYRYLKNSYKSKRKRQTTPQENGQTDLNITKEERPEIRKRVTVPVSLTSMEKQIKSPTSYHKPTEGPTRKTRNLPVISKD